MRITKSKDIKNGHFITFRSNYNGETSRKFYKVVDYDDFEFLCKTLYVSSNRPDDFYDTVIDNVFGHSEDEVFTTEEELKKHFPEEFI